MKKSTKRMNTLLLAGVLIISLACNWLSPAATAQVQEEAQPIPAATSLSTVAVPQDLPPALVETEPSANGVVKIGSPLVFYFNQAMEKTSVEAAFVFEPAIPVRFEWSNDTTVLVLPESALPLDSTLAVRIETSAKAANGKAIRTPVEIQFNTARSLNLVEALPAAGSAEVDPSSAVMVTFNQPVVALTAEGSVSEPQAFTLSPQATGKGEWLNTSTYIFYPNPPLYGGTHYSVSLNKELASTGGAQLSLNAGQMDTWEFLTSLPALVTYTPTGEDSVGLDDSFTFEFNQPMDESSLENGFSFKTLDGLDIPGTFEWNEISTRVVFKPDELLQRSTRYLAAIDKTVKAAGGAELEYGFLQAFDSVEKMAIAELDPELSSQVSLYSGGYGSFNIHFTSPLAPQNLAKLISFTPAASNVNTYTDADRILYVSGYFEPNTDYTLTLAAEIVDQWGQTLASPAVIHFRTSNLAPSLYIPAIQTSGSIVFFTPQDTEMTAQATNLNSIELSSAPLTLEQFIAAYQNGIYDSSSPVPYTETWTQNIDSQNQNKNISLSIVPPGKSYGAGLYYYSLYSEELVHEGSYQVGPFLAVVSPTHLTLKRSGAQVTIWAVDLETNQPVANSEVKIFSGAMELLGSEQTDANGVATISLPEDFDLYATLFAVMGQPGDAQFTLATDFFTSGVSGSSFGYWVSTSKPALTAYLYTDRPIYQAGQTVDFRVVVRQADNGRYSPAGMSQITAEVYGDYSAVNGQFPLIASQTLTLSAYGTAAGEAVLPQDAAPGNYSIRIKEISGVDLYFTVAEYRKPEIELKVDFTRKEWKAGEDIEAKIQTDYYFGAPAGNLPIRWTLYRNDAYFQMPYGYQVGGSSFYSEMFDSSYYSPMGEYITEGTGKTNPDGSLTVSLPYALFQSNLSQEEKNTLILEVTVEDQTMLSVSGRAETAVHPADFYIGLRPDSWNGRAKEAIGFAVQTVDWEEQASPNHALKAVFQKVTWELKEDVPSGSYPEYQAVYEEIASSDFVTDAQGQAYLSFTPQDPGTYELKVSGGNAITRIMLWVGGSGSAVWPVESNQHITITSEATSYTPGEEAKLFIPNPLNESALAWITVERGKVMSSEVVRLDGSSYEYTLPITDELAPNVFVSVTLLGQNEDGRLDFRQGYLELDVDVANEKLDVQIIAQPEETAPGQPVTFTMEVKDAQGNPVAGEFSLAVVDKAVLALKDSNASTILDAFYGNQALGVNTSLAMAAYVGRFVPMSKGGLGGGGGDSVLAPSVRQNFKDSAYWNPAILTDSQGRATIEMTLPDNLTTWVALMRGLTVDTKVGEAETEVITSKPLLVRPVTPRFVVEGDHFQAAAVVHNNTTAAFTAEVSLQANGFILDEGQALSAQVDIPAGESRRVEWWGKVDDSDEIDLIFSAKAGDLQDATTPADGAIPVYHYSSPQTYGTAGILTDPGETLEVVSMPRTFTPSGGEFRLEMSPSLAGVVMDGLEAMKQFPGDFTEPISSRLLSNVITYQLLKENGTLATTTLEELPGLIQADISSLTRTQNGDGGWGWMSGSNSDTYLSSYVVLALYQAQEAGFLVDALQVGADYLSVNIPSTEAIFEPWQYDRLAFQHYVLQLTGSSGLDSLPLYNNREQMNSWAKALLAWTILQQQPGNETGQDLLNNVESEAELTATGTHWKDRNDTPENYTSAVFETGVVQYILAKIDPQSTLIDGSVRYLVYHRNATGCWTSSYESAWVLMALGEVMKATHELNADFKFSAAVNGSPLAVGDAAGDPGQIVSATIPLEQLSADEPNAVQITHDEGIGRLYYRAFLQVYQPVEGTTAVDKGVTIERRFENVEGCEKQPCEAVQEVSLANIQQPILVRISLTVPDTLYYLVVEDFIPAGAEIVNTELNTSPLGMGEFENVDAQDPLGDGWRWWFFSSPRIYDNHIRWIGYNIPAGTYELTYRITPYQPGEYRVLPAHAFEYYFPEVEGSSAGEIFTIKP